MEGGEGGARGRGRGVMLAHGLIRIRKEAREVKTSHANVFKTDELRILHYIDLKYYIDGHFNITTRPSWT